MEPAYSDPPQVLDRTGHCAVTFGDKIIVLGGYAIDHDDEDNGNYKTDFVQSYSHERGRWSTVNCMDPFQPHAIVFALTGFGAHVIDDMLYVLFGFRREYEYIDFDNEDGESLSAGLDHGSNMVYTLNLNNFEWESMDFQMGDEDPRPLPCDKMASWTHNGYIYSFGGFGDVSHGTFVHPFTKICHSNSDGGARCWNNQFVRYDPEENVWEWPETTGKKPFPRAAHTAVICGNDVFVFGGRNNGVRLNDLYHLDMLTFKWTRLNKHTADNPDIPKGRTWHTLTKVGGNRAILYGGYDTEQNPLSDCWELDVSPLERARRSERLTRWKRLAHLDRGPRLWHSAVYHETSAQLWLIGGHTTDILSDRIPREHSKVVDKLDLSVPSLQYLAMNAAVKNKKAINLKNEVHYLPKTMTTPLKYRLDKNYVPENFLLSREARNFGGHFHHRFLPYDPAEDPSASEA